MPEWPRGINEEMRQHLDDEYRALRAGGVPHDEAMRRLTGRDQPERLTGSLVSSDVFKAVGIQPMVGRTFAPDEDKPGAPRIAVVSERFWRSHFNADAAAIGASITLNGEPHTIVGVMPA